MSDQPLDRGPGLWPEPEQCDLPPEAWEEFGRDGYVEFTVALYGDGAVFGVVYGLTKDATEFRVGDSKLEEEDWYEIIHVRSHDFHLFAALYAYSHGNNPAAFSDGYEATGALGRFEKGGLVEFLFDEEFEQEYLTEECPQCGRHLTVVDQRKGCCTNCREPVPSPVADQD